MEIQTQEYASCLTLLPWLQIRMLIADPEEKSSLPIEVLFEDEHLIAVFKPHRMPIQSEKHGHAHLFEQTCQWIKGKEKTQEKIFLGMVHRLDRPVSGVVLFAKSSKVASHLSSQFRERRVGKVYEALVQGRISEKKGVLSSFLLQPDEGPSQVYAEKVEGSKHARLEYQVVESYEKYSRLEIKLITGRRHQIRAQMSSIGYPVVGDGKYGSSIAYFQGSIALIAKELIFVHPIINKTQTIRLPDFYSSIDLFLKTHSSVH